MTDKDKLSQEEVDALLGEVDNLDLESGEATVSSEDTPSKIRDYDFASQERIVSGSMSGLYSINERFVRNFRTSLTNLLRRGVNISLAEIVSIKAPEYLASLETPSCMNIFRMRPLQGMSLCVFDTTLVFNLVDSLFGGGTIVIDESQEKEEFTEMEIRIVQLVLELLFKDFTHAWQTIYPIKFEGQGLEINPQLINVASQNEVMIVCRYNVALEGSKTTELNISIPYSTLEPIRAALESGLLEQEDVDENWVHRLREEIFDAPIELSADVAEAHMSFKKLVGIKVGDVIPINLHEMITVHAAGMPTFRARFGLSKESCALKIMGRADRE